MEKDCRNASHATVIAWIYGNGKTSSHFDIYPRNSIWESTISAPFTIA